MMLLKQYIAHGILPDDPVAARKTRTIIARYVMMQDNLYCILGDWPVLKYILEEDGAYVLREMHKGICGVYIKVSTLVRKVMRYGYFWPTMKEAAKEMVHICHRFQIQDKGHHVP